MPLTIQSKPLIVYNLKEWKELNVKMPIYGATFHIKNFIMTNCHIDHNGNRLGPILHCIDIDSGEFIIFEYYNNGIKQLKHTNMSIDVIYKLTDELIKIHNGIIDVDDDNTKLTFSNYYKWKDIYNRLFVDLNGNDFDLNNYQFEYMTDDNDMRNKYLSVNYKSSDKIYYGRWIFSINHHGYIDLHKYVSNNHILFVEMLELLMEYIKNKVNSFDMAIEI